MNKLILMIFSFAFLVIDLSGKGSLPVFSIEKSEEVFLGKFDTKDISYILLVPSNQKTIYPIPNLDSNEKIRVATNRKFISDFAETLKSSDNATLESSKDFIESFHLFIVFSKGDNACLHGAIYGKKFLIQPLFKENSITLARNKLYNFILKNKLLFVETSSFHHEKKEESLGDK